MSPRRLYSARNAALLGYIFPNGQTTSFKTSSANDTCSLMDRPSQWEWPWKLLALVLFGLGVAAVWWFFHKLAFEWLPESVVGYVFVAMMAFCAGGLFGRWLMARELREQSAPDRR